MTDEVLVAAAPGFADGVGEMTRRVGAFDWGATAVGPRERWSASLRTAVEICLRSRHPVDILLGPDYVQLYNDAYRPMLGAKHPAALGQPARECWAEIWTVVGPLLDAVFATGQACWFEDLPLELRRNGYEEETYFTFSYARLDDEHGSPLGVFVEALETTADVIGRRRHALLYELATRMADVFTTDQACDVLADVLGGAALDVPFAALYFAETAEEPIRCCLHVGAIDGLPEVLGPEGHETSPVVHAAEEALRRREMVVRRDIRAGPSGNPHAAVALPVQLPGQERIAGALVLGASPRRAFDTAYCQFLEIVCTHVTAALARAHAHGEEQRRIVAETALDVRERAEAVLRRQALVFEMLSEAVILSDPDGNVTAWNPAAEAMTGFARDEAAGRRIPQQIADIDGTLINRIRSTVLRDGVWSGEVPFRRKDGVVRIGEAATAGEYDSSGRLIGAITIVRDVTERRRAEAALRRRTEQLAAIVQMQQDVGMVALDVEAVVRRIAASAQQLTGADGALIAIPDGDEIVVSAATGWLAPRLGERVRGEASIAAWSLRTGQVARIDDTYQDERVHETMRDSYGRSVIAVPLIYDHERIGVLAVGAGRPDVFGDHDEQALTLTAGLLAAAMAHAIAFETKRRLVRERTVALAALEQSEERLRALSESSPAGIFAADERGQNTYANARLAELVGAPVESFRGDGWQCYVHPDDRESFVQRWTRVVAAREPMTGELRFVSRTGRVIVTRLRSAPLVLGSGQLVGFVGTCEDVTEQKAAEEALRRAERQYRELVDSMDAVVWRASGDPPRLTFVSQQAEDFFGRSAASLVGREAPCFDVVHADDLARVRGHVADVQRLHEAVQFDVRVHTAGPDRWLRSLLSPVREGAEPGEVIGVTFDVTELRLAREELARSQQQLRDFASQLQTVRERERTHIAREIHDELGQALTGLKMEIAWLRTKLPKRSAQLIESADQMVTQVDRTIETVRRIASELRPSVLDSLGLVAALEWQVREFERRSRIHCTLRVGDDGTEPDAERSTAIFRIVQEALTNVARHGRASAAEVHVAHGDGAIVVSVRDNGCGIPATAHDGRSLGILGMRERALSCGGELSISAAPEGGTIVAVRMPLGTAAGAEEGG